MNDSEKTGATTGEPLITVVIPVYNVKSYMSECIESVIGQTYRNMQVILVDDGSTDGSGEMCDEFASRDARIRVIHTENHGLAAARNVGIENASGEYITFLDSDDWVEPDTFESLLKTALKYEADITAAGMSAEYVGMTVGANKKSDEVKVYRGEEILPAYAKTRIGNVATNKLYRIECFGEFRFPYGRVYEDVPVAWRLMTALAKNGGTVAVMPDKLYHIRMRKGSLSHVKSYKNVVDCWTSYYEKYENMPGYEDQCLPHCFMAIGSMWGNWSDFSKEDKKKAAELIDKMHSFSKENRERVKNGDFPRLTKFISTYSQRKGRVVMRLCNWGVKLRSVFSKTDKKMYD